MGKLITSSEKCIHYYERKFFQHGMWGIDFENQNLKDFGYIYYIQNGSKNLVGSCIYEFDYYSIYNGNISTLGYLCDERGNQYVFNKTTATHPSYNKCGSYRSIDSEKLIHNNNFLNLNLNPTSNAIYNNRGNWYGHNITSSIGGGINITYTPSVSGNDDIYVYLTNGNIGTSYFELYSMTDPDELSSNGQALYSNILHAYVIGNSYDYLSKDRSANISIIFNNIAKNPTSNKYSIFYGVNTWVYIYSPAGSFQNKKALVQKYNDDYQTRPYEKVYTLDHYDNNVGYSIIGFPMFEWRNTGSGGYLVNYYNILISDYDVSRAMVTINFDDLGMTVSINGNMCNSGDIYYYTLGTTLNFVATVNDEFAGGRLYVDWIVNGERLTESHEVTSTFSLLVNNNMTYNVAVGLTVSSAPHPNPNPNPDLWG